MAGMMVDNLGALGINRWPRLIAADHVHGERLLSAVVIIGNGVDPPKLLPATLPVLMIAPALSR